MEAQSPEIGAALRSHRWIHPAAHAEHPRIHRADRHIGVGLRQSWLTRIGGSGALPFPTSPGRRWAGEA